MLALTGMLLAGCQRVVPITEPGKPTIKVLAAESFLTDIAQNVAGTRLHVDTLMPLGTDPHTYEPTPKDVTKIADADLLFINGAGFEGWLANLIATSASKAVIIQASNGLTARTPKPGELAGGSASDIDPHFWLDPTKTVRYVENIRDALGAADPGGISEYTANAAAYIKQLQDLDASLMQQVSVIPEAKRLIVTNHDDFGYFADRYGFTIVGTILASISSEASPSAQQVAQLVNQIKATGTKVIFLETGVNKQLPDQISKETGAKVIADLYTHSLTAAGGIAPTYIAMMQYDVKQIVQALTQ
ncbi:MAG: metal ABC transporter solute-binding protein, Zn/Mn family [Anaerolineae bacterium]